VPDIAARETRKVRRRRVATRRHRLKSLMLFRRRHTEDGLGTAALR
jgi:hypothetical protein